MEQQKKNVFRMWRKQSSISILNGTSKERKKKITIQIWKISKQKTSTHIERTFGAEILETDRNKKNNKLWRAVHYSNRLFRSLNINIVENGFFRGWGSQGLL